MIAEAMLDTNILVYATSRNPDEKPKQLIAMSLLQSKLAGISGQVLQEFYVTTTRKVRKPLTGDEALDWIEQFEELPCVPVDATVVRKGAEYALRYKLSYWDGAIIAAANRLGAKTLYTEDLNHGQAYGAVTAINPFKAI